MRAFLYVRTERRILLEDVAEVPTAGAQLESDGREYRVTEVLEQGAGEPAIVFLEPLRPLIRAHAAW